MELVSFNEDCDDMPQYGSAQYSERQRTLSKIPLMRLDACTIFVFITCCALYWFATRAMVHVRASLTKFVDPSRDRQVIDPPPRFCMDMNVAECTRLAAGGSPTSAGCEPKHGNHVSAMCPWSCGICAIMLSGCERIGIVKNSVCVEGRSNVGQICMDAVDSSAQAYCTWTGLSDLPSPHDLQRSAKTELVCAYCADNFVTPGRRVLIKQIEALRWASNVHEEGWLNSARDCEQLPWSSLTLVEQHAAYTLGWDKNLWDSDSGPRGALKDTPWADLSAQQQHAASTLGINAYKWDNNV